MPVNDDQSQFFLSGTFTAGADTLQLSQVSMSRNLFFVIKVRVEWARVFGQGSLTEEEGSVQLTSLY